jgi:RNA polymerase sigma-70 factor (ECF subfamily)
MRVDRGQTLQLLRERLFAFAASHYGRDAADDLAQETLMVLHEKYPQVEAMAELVPLSMQILRFKINALRRRSVRRGEFTALSVDDIALPDPANAVSELERRDLLQRLKAALPQLGDHCRELFRLKLQGLTFPEIQTRLGAASINTVYTWDSRCRKQLLERVGGTWEVRP